MKRKVFRMTALVCACLMLACMGSFAASRSAPYQGNYVQCSLTCGSTGAGATTSYGGTGVYRSVSLTVDYSYYGTGARVLYDSDTDSMNNVTGDVHANCSYPSAIKAYAVSNHSVNPGWSATLTENWP